MVTSFCSNSRGELCAPRRNALSTNRPSRWENPATTALLIIAGKVSTGEYFKKRRVSLASETNKRVKCHVFRLKIAGACSLRLSTTKTPFVSGLCKILCCSVLPTTCNECIDHDEVSHRLGTHTFCDCVASNPGASLIN